MPNLIRKRRINLQEEEEKSVEVVAAGVTAPNSPRWISVTKKNPSILVLPVLVCLLLLAAGLVVAFTLDRTVRTSRRDDALALAEDVGRLFSTSLDQALLPVFSLAQFVTEIEAFAELPQKIGPAFEEGSLPFLTDKNNTHSHRNVTGVCDDEIMLERWNNIASGIIRNAKMEGILVGLGLAPQAVICMLYPKINTEDYPGGISLNIAGAIGRDLITDPDRNFIVKQAYREVPTDGGLMIIGPINLEIKQSEDCAPTVRKALVVRLPIYSKTNVITVNGVDYPRWGFAVAMINWDAVVRKSGVYNTFEEAGLEFQLTRTDVRVDDDGRLAEKVVVLANTTNFDQKKENGFLVVSAALETTNNQWVIEIAYSDGSHVPIFFWMVSTSAMFAFCISLLLYCLLVQKQVHSEVRGEQTALLIKSARQAALSERALNEFIAHEVRNPLSAAMSACTFVKTAVHENEHMNTQLSRQAVRDDVNIIENSLRFINELLRSMLDIHMAQDKQMILHIATVDVRLDILEPVKAMLYHRDERFTVEIDCQPERILVEADRLRLQQVILNLGRNSTKFVDNGFVRLGARVEDGNVALFVEDSGPGVPIEKRNNLFCRFQESLDSMAQGTGVGLNLCKSLVGLMQGDIWLDESFETGIKGRPGSRIVIDLKKSPSLSDAKENSMLISTRALSDDAFLEEGWAPLPTSLNILFVDDDRILRKLGLRTMAKLVPSWNVREASSGETALQLLKTESFDIIFMDQYMASSSGQALKGTETIRALRAEGVTSIVCGLSANNLEDNFKDAGANKFILKPFPCKKDELIPVLTSLLYTRPP